jgi:hypothetical protein
LAPSDECVQARLFDPCWIAQHVAVALSAGVHCNVRFWLARSGHRRGFGRYVSIDYFSCKVFIFFFKTGEADTAAGLLRESSYRTHISPLKPKPAVINTVIHSVVMDGHFNPLQNLEIPTKSASRRGSRVTQHSRSNNSNVLIAAEAAATGVDASITSSADGTTIVSYFISLVILSSKQNLKFSGGFARTWRRGTDSPCFAP